MEPRVSIITLGVKEMPQAIRFYRDGMGLPTSAEDNAAIAFFKMSGTCFALYPYEKLAEDVAANWPTEKGAFSGITLAHNTREKYEVKEVLAQAQAAGGNIVKPAQDAFWGGYHGYFTDLDGYLWEVAWSESWQFNPDGSLVIP